MKEKDAWLLLNAQAGLWPQRARELAVYFGSPAAIFDKSIDELLESALLPPDLAEHICHFSKDKFLSAEYNLMQQKSVEALTWSDESFPKNLRQIPGAPNVLYYRGKLEALALPMISMVGSRVCTAQGCQVAERFASELSSAGLAIVSGMARGIDTASHRGALKSGGITVAVLGCGLGGIYPNENKSLAQEIILKGALVSEMPMNTPPLPMHFPRRNRIITGLGLLTLVIEAGNKSGALISADYALEQGKDVFVVPSLVDNPCAKGSNRLIKDGARLALEPGDILEEIGEQYRLLNPLAPGQKAVITLNDNELQVYKALGFEPIHLDELAAKSKLSLAQTMACVLHLEIKAVIKELPGQYYMKEDHGKITRHS